MRKTAQLTLEHGIERDGKMITEITLTAPNAGALRNLKYFDIVMLDIDALMVLLPRISTPTVMEEEVANFTFADLTRFAEAFSVFFERGSTSPTV